MNINEYTKMVRYHHEVLNKKCEDHISDCLCFDCMTQKNSALMISKYRGKFIGFVCKCKECSK